MKKMFILSVLLLSTVGVLTNPIVVKAEEVDNQEEIVVDGVSAPTVQKFPIGTRTISTFT